MLGTSVIYSSGDNGVAGTNFTRGSSICLNSKRMSLRPWSAILLFFWHSCMKTKKMLMGKSLTQRFLYVQTRFLSFPNDTLTRCSTSVYVSVRNVCRSNPNETRIYGRWPGGSCGSPLVRRALLFQWWFLEHLLVRLLLFHILTRTLTRSITQVAWLPEKCRWRLFAEIFEAFSFCGWPI